MNRFAYEIAEERLEAFVARYAPEPSGLRRAWAQFGAAVATCALIDYRADGREIALSRAWEEADAAFRGFGEEFLTGAVVALWKYVPREDHPAFREAIAEAFAAAHAATPRRVRRLHHRKTRNAPVRDLEMGFDQPVHIPVYGPRLRDWLAPLADELGETVEFLEAVVKLKLEGRLKKPEPPPRRGSHLRLVE